MAHDGLHISARQLRRDVVTLIAGRLPTGWSLRADERPRQQPDGADLALELTAPDGRSVALLGEVKLSALTGPQIVGTAGRMRDRAAVLQGVPLLISRYLSPNARAQLEVAGVSYADATGNIMLSAINPGFYLSDRGADADPWRSAGRPRGTLKGEPAARVVRTLLDHRRAWRVSDLIRASGASTGATYRVLDYLEREGLAERATDRTWAVVEWEPLLRSWASDYHFLEDGSVTRYIDPRGTAHLLQQLADSPRTYALTGAAAARDWVSIVPARALFVYTEHAEADAAAWGLHPADDGANVVLVEPRKVGPIVFANTAAMEDSVRRASTIQVATDLLNGPGRDPAQGEALIGWMNRNERLWRIN